ncbi:MAG: TRAP transporter small permease [Xanthobacteraceae bacterium]|nr:TRAP transporter small permease [Xanthobacteraceae bacterium]
MLVKLLSGIRIAERALLAGLMIGMSVLFFLNVMARELFPKLAVELAWVEEATLFALAWTVFVGMGLVLEQRRHIAMTAYSDTLPARTAHILHKVINFSGIVFCALLTKFGYDFVAFAWRSGQISPTLGFSIAVLYLPLPIGFALLTLRYLLEFCGVQDRFTIKDVITDH